MNYSQPGTTGTDGSNGAGPGDSGGQGLSGGDASLSLVDHADGDNQVTATGGNGGAGGAGGSGAGPGGDGGAGGAGGNATASVSDVNNLGYTTTQYARAYGGSGGAAGAPGNAGSGDTGSGAIGGAGGTATATSYSRNDASRASAIAVAIGGAGGAASGPGGVGGAGGMASNTQATVIAAPGYIGYARASQIGGTGGFGSDGAVGGAGADSILVDAVDGAADGDTLTLRQYATGGSGGGSSAFAAGQAGNVSSSLTVATPSAALYLSGRSDARGGAGGYGAAGSAGGTADAAIALTGTNSVDASARADGGAAGRSYANTDGAAGGAATATASATSTTAGPTSVTARAVAYGGRGGHVDAGYIASGGAGGAVTASSATATSATATAGSPGAYAVAIGGAGGRGQGAGESGGAGGVASGAIAMATGPSATAEASQTGGAGGAGYGGAIGGNGASSSIANAVNGNATEYLRLRQYAVGGAGGASDAQAGLAGDATSTLTRHETVAYALDARTRATGGAGGARSGGGIGSAGGAATAATTLTGSRALDARAYAIGGTGGIGYGYANGTAGGAGGTAGSTASATSSTAGPDDVSATAYATGGSGGNNGYSSTGYGGLGQLVSGTSATVVAATASGGDQTAVANARGGSGGAGAGVGYRGGSGGVAQDTIATGIGDSGHLDVSVYQRSGDGGRGNSGADGGDGAASTLTDAVSGTSRYMLHFRQYAHGGAGGYSFSGSAGAAGAASSGLTVTDLLAEYLGGYVRAQGGRGGGTYYGTASSGAMATVNADVTGSGRYVDASAFAGGGDGGNSDGTSAGGAGGTAVGSAQATSTSSGETYVDSDLRLYGGNGGNVGFYSNGNASGGAGAAITGGSSSALALSATDGDAYASAHLEGGGGGNGYGAGNSGGAGGIASGGSAFASHQSSAYAALLLFGGDGGDGQGGAGGGAGAAVAAANQVTGTTSGRLSLVQHAGGGDGGDSSYGAGGAGGYASSLLTYTAPSANRSYAATRAEGGDGGDSYLGGAAGAGAVATVSLTGSSRVVASSFAEGGAGGRGRGSAAGGAGASPTSSASATSTTTGFGPTYAYATSRGGRGGSASYYTGEYGNGGAGGAAPASTSATATALTATSGTTRAQASSEGGYGGSGRGLGNTGGAGGAATGTVAAASGTTAQAYVVQTGGRGGRGRELADGATGADSVLVNAVSGSASNALYLGQTANGGNGGSSVGGAGGSAGSGDSSLTVADAAATYFKGRSSAAGGVGGASYDSNYVVRDGADGGSGNATIALTGTRAVVANALAYGGAGGTGTNGAIGGAATGSASATTTSSGADRVYAGNRLSGGSGATQLHSYGYVGNGGAGGTAIGGSATATAANTTGETARARAYSIGGGGGRARGETYSGGAGGIASDTMSHAVGFNATAEVYQRGGYGGNGLQGASGGAGAASSLSNAASGTTTGLLTLLQSAQGGDGGYSDGKAPGSASGSGGAGVSQLTVTDTTAAGLDIQARALGGHAGQAYGPSIMGTGGEAVATVDATGVQSVVVTANATAGSAIESTTGDAIATATGSATGSQPAGTATVYANATGGILDLSQSRGNATADATAQTTSGQLAQSRAIAKGFGNARSTAITADGGIVSLVTADADAEVTGQSGARSQAAANSIFAFDGFQNSAYAFASVVPNPTLVGILLGANAAVDAVLGSGNANARIFGAGIQGGAYSYEANTAEHTYLSAISYTIDSTLFSGDLIAGLIDTQLFDTGFVNLEFGVVIDSVTVASASFTDAATAQAYFDDQALNLGPVAALPNLVVTFSLELTSNDLDSGYGIQFLLGTTNGNLPPVNTVPGLQTGLATVQLPVAGVSIADPDTQPAEIYTSTASSTATLISTSETTGVTGSGTTTLVVTGTLAEVNAALAALAIQRNSGGTDTITITTKDASGGTDTDAFKVDIAALPELSIAADQVSLNEGNSSSTAFVFTVSRSGDSSIASSASYAVSGAAGADFVGGSLPTGTVSFGIGDTTAAITIAVAGDTTVEADETFTVQLSAPSLATIATAAAFSTITNDDFAPPELSITADKASQNEGNSGSTDFTFIVTRTGADLSGTSAVNYGVGGVANATDFGGVLPSGTVNFAANQTEAVITIAVSGDTTVETSELFLVSLSGATGATIGLGAAFGSILNDDIPPPQLSIAANQASLNEGNSGSTGFVFTVTRTGDLGGTSSASYGISAGTANAIDFGGAFPTGSVAFAIGEDTASFTINVSGDTTVEGDESFTVQLSDLVGAVAPLGPPLIASSSILNDDVPPPVIAIAAAQVSLNEGNSGSTSFVFTVTRSGDLSGASSASYAVAGAADAADFGGVLPSGSVSFAIGEDTVALTIAVSGDTAVEADEAFTVTLSAPAGATLGTSVAGSTITNDDVPPPVISIAAAQLSLNEGNSGSTAFVFTVTRSGDLSGASSASYAVSGAADAADFGGVLPSGNVSFAIGEDTIALTIAVSGDTAVEPDEAFTVTLSAPTGATLGTSAAGSTILNDDAAPPVIAIAAAQVSLDEGDSGSTSFVFTVTRSGDLTGTSSASYAVSGAADAADFGGVLPSGNVSFAIGEDTVALTIAVSGDTAVEADEAFTVTLSAPAGATLGTSVAGSTITNDDVPPPVISIAAAQLSLNEGNSGSTAFVFTVTRSGDLTGTSSASYAVSGAADAADFGGVLPSGNVSFAIGEDTVALTIAVSGDTAVEADEAFTVTLSAPAGATLGTSAAGSTITNDDVPPPVISIAAAQVSLNEGNSGSTSFVFTVTRSGDLSGASSASYAVSGDADAADFGGVLPSGSVSFAIGEDTVALTIAVSGDTAVEADEAFTVTLSAPTGATLGTSAAGSTITNDDTLVVLTTIGGAGAYSRSNPNAWRDAWAAPKLLIAHRHDGSDTGEPWLAANFGTAGPGTYGGSDVSIGNLGVAGRAGGTQPTPQEIDGTEALRFSFANDMSSFEFTFDAFGGIDLARVTAYDSLDAVVAIQDTSTSGLSLTGLVGVRSVVVTSEQGSFNVDKLTFG